MTVIGITSKMDTDTIYNSWEVTMLEMVEKSSIELEVIYRWEMIWQVFADSVPEGVKTTDRWTWLMIVDTAVSLLYLNESFKSFIEKL